MLKSLKIHLSLLFVASMLAACAQLGLPTADTFNEKLAVAYGSVTQVRSSALQLLEAKKISADDAANVNTTADTARAALDIARKTSLTDITAANSKLTAATAILNAVSVYLATKQEGK